MEPSLISLTNFLMSSLSSLFSSIFLMSLIKKSLADTNPFVSLKIALKIFLFGIRFPFIYLEIEISDTLRILENCFEEILFNCKYSLSNIIYNNHIGYFFNNFIISIAASGILVPGPNTFVTPISSRNG